MDTQERLEALRKLQYLLDNAFRVPGTRLRFGLDPLVGLLPWVGDALTAVFACAILLQATRMRVPRVVQARMFANTAIDVIVGSIPLVGDVTDVFWKSNARNFALLERHAGGSARPSVGDWLFVGGMLAAVLIAALMPMLVVYWLYLMLAGR